MEGIIRITGERKSGNTRRNRQRKEKMRERKMKPKDNSEARERGMRNDDDGRRALLGEKPCATVWLPL